MAISTISLHSANQSSMFALYFMAMTVKDLPILKHADKSGLHRNADIEDGAAMYGKNSDKQREAAVLIPLVKTAEQWHLLFIRRAANDRDRHSGQVAFPGGAAEQDDGSATATALRETTEEIGVTPDRIKVIAELGPYYTISHFRVTPVVGIMQWPSNLSLEASEVARAFLIPMPWLQDSANFTMRARNEYDKQSAMRHPIIVYNEFDGETLWGATARMTMNFFKALDDDQFLLPA